MNSYKPIMSIRDNDNNKYVLIWFPDCIILKQSLANTTYSNQIIDLSISKELFMYIFDLIGTGETINLFEKIIISKLDEIQIFTTSGSYFISIKDIVLKFDENSNSKYKCLHKK